MHIHNLYKKTVIFPLVSLMMLHSITTHGISGYMPNRDTFKCMGLLFCGAIGGLVVGGIMGYCKKNNELRASNDKYKQLDREFTDVKSATIPLLYLLYDVSNETHRRLVIPDTYTNDDVKKSLIHAKGNIDTVLKTNYPEFRKLMTLARVNNVPDNKKGRREE